MTVKISTLSVMWGTPACPLKCPYCISKTTFRVKAERPATPAAAVRYLANDFLRKTGNDYRFTTPTMTLPLGRIRFLADKFMSVHDGLPYGIITGKGEPTLTPIAELGDVVDLLANLKGRQNGLIPELQTSGVLLNQEKIEYLKIRGLNTLALSCVSQFDEINSRILSGGKLSWNLGSLVSAARNVGLLSRLTVIMTRGGVENPDAIFAFLKWAQEAGAQQVTFRKMGEPRNLALPGSLIVSEFIKKNYVPPEMALEALKSCPQAREQDPLPWSRRYSLYGMSVVVTECMSPPKDGLARSAVIQPDGHLYLSWDDPADIAI